jgi:hypothetical protein
MTTRVSPARAIEVPDLVGDKADQAIQELRALGLMPITWSSAVEDVNDAGFVLGLDPPPGTPVRPKAHVTMSVATHPDFQGHAEDAIDSLPDPLVQTPLTWPLSSPTGFAAPAATPTSEALTEAFQTAATPDAPSAPASSPFDAAFREVRRDAAGPSSAAEEPTPGVAADLYALGIAAPVPTPDEISADAEWDRLRAAEAARHAAGRPGSTESEAAPTIAQPAGSADDAAPPESAEALEEQARREARRRSARRHRRLTLKQKAVVGGVLALTLLIVLGAMSGHKPTVRPPAAAHTAAHRVTAPAGTTPAPSTSAPNKRPKARKPRVVVRWRTRTRVVRVKVHTPAPSSPQSSASSPAAPVSAAPSNAAAPSTGAGVAPTTSGGSASPPATSTPSQKTASTPSAADSRSSGHGGGSTLQSPDGSTAPPQP